MSDTLLQLVVDARYTQRHWKRSMLKALNEFPICFKSLLQNLTFHSPQASAWGHSGSWNSGTVLTVSEAAPEFSISLC